MTQMRQIINTCVVMVAYDTSNNGLPLFLPCNFRIMGEVGYLCQEKMYFDNQNEMNSAFINIRKVHFKHSSMAIYLNKACQQNPNNFMPEQKYVILSPYYWLDVQNLA